MTKQAGMGDQLYVGGYNLSGDTGSLSRVGGGPAALDLTGIDKSAPERVGGLRDGMIEFSAWFNKSAAQAHPVLAALPTADVISMYLRGQAIGGQGACLVARQVNYDGNRGADGSLSFAVSMQADGFGLEWGDQLTAGIRTDTTATNGTALDFGAVSTLFGGQAYLESFALTGTSATVKLQDSADNVSFLDISGAGFTAFTGRGAQRIAFSGTVRRYVRAVTTGTFTNAQFAVVFNRNLTLTAF